MRNKLSRGNEMDKKDLLQDKKMVKKAVKMHDDQLHGGKKTNLTKLKSGGLAAGHKSANGIAKRGKTKGMAVTMCSGGMTKKGK